MPKRTHRFSAGMGGEVNFRGGIAHVGEYEYYNAGQDTFREEGWVRLLYLDESGDHNLARVDASYPVFVLGGIIVDRTYARTVLEPRVRDFKRQWLGASNIVLHSTDITRSRNGFERLRDASFRREFLPALSTLMAELDYQVVACLVRKDEPGRILRNPSDNLYGFALELVVERFCLAVGDEPDSGLIYAEKRREDLDLTLDIAWERLSERGTRILNQQRRGLINERICGLGLKAKGVNLAGLQLADLVVSVIGRHASGRNTHDNWEIVRSKLWSVDGRVDGFGLIALP